MSPSIRKSDELRQILGVKIAAITVNSAQQILKRLIAGGEHYKVAFANAHSVKLASTDKDLAAILNDFIVLPDGVGVDIASNVLYHHSFPANLNGTDFVPRFLAEHSKPLKVMLLGSKPGIPERAAQAFTKIAPQHQFQALSHGFFDLETEAALLARLEQDPPDVLLVAMGNPIQEKWIARCITPAHARIVMGVGALFDFMSGSVIRAPAKLRALRFEWLWRLLMEPRRLARRYILGLPVFLWYVMLQRLSRL